jgi:hypothetical protein
VRLDDLWRLCKADQIVNTAAGVFLGLAAYWLLICFLKALRGFGK